MQTLPLTGILLRFTWAELQVSLDTRYPFLVILTGNLLLRSRVKIPQILLTLTVYFWYKNNPGTKTNLYDPYAMGYRRAAQTTPMWYKIVRSS